MIPSCAGKSDGKIVEIVGGGHHHGVSKTVIAEGDRGLLRDADQPVLFDAVWLRDHISGNGNDSFGRVLKRLVHRVARSTPFKAPSPR